MTFYKAIKVANKAYGCDGMVFRYYCEPHEYHGDGLAQFVQYELAATYSEYVPDEENRAEIAQAMRVAAAQLLDVAEAFE